MTNQEIKVTVFRGFFLGFIAIGLLMLGRCPINDTTSKMTLDDKVYQRIRDKQEQRRERMEKLRRRYNSRDYR